MPTTANKAYSTPAYNTAVGTWGTTDLNGNFTTIDSNIAGVASISLSSANVTLSGAQAQNLVIKLSGTLLANVTVSSPIIGFCIVENNTSGAYTVTWQANFGAGNIGSGFVLGQGARTFLVSDTSVGARPVVSGALVSGTKTVFYQSSSPPGWTQITTINDYLLRIVNGAGGGATAGSGFSTVNALISTANHILTTAEMPSHSHTDSGHTHEIGYNALGAGGSNYNSVGSPTFGGGLFSKSGHANIQSTGGDNGHAHLLSLGISYVDMILCQCN